MLEGTDGGTVPWQPNQIAGRAGGVEVYRAEGIELRTGDRVRWTRNEKGLGLVNSRTAEVAKVKNGRVTFRLEDGRTLELGRNDPQPHHLDHAWASTVHAFQGRTVDNVVPSMARGVRRQLLPPSRRGRRRIVLSGPSVALPILLFGSEGLPPVRRPPPESRRLPAVDSRLALPDSRTVAATSRLSTAPTRHASTRQTSCYIVIALKC